MENNDLLRRLRYALVLNDNTTIRIFKLADLDVTREQVTNWRKKDDEEGYQPINDRLLATFLNGFINYKRGKREGEQPIPEKQLTNNIIFMKLKIALNLKSDDIIDMLERADFVMSKHELSAFFRKKGHKHYRECKDQVLRNFIQGIQLKYRVPKHPSADSQKTSSDAPVIKSSAPSNKASKSESKAPSVYQKKPILQKAKPSPEAASVWGKSK